MRNDENEKCAERDRKKREDPDYVKKERLEFARLNYGFMDWELVSPSLPITTSSLN
jgi:hypothetical protein